MNFCSADSLTGQVPGVVDLNLEGPCGPEAPPEAVSGTPPRTSQDLCRCVGVAREGSVIMTTLGVASSAIDKSVMTASEARDTASAIRACINQAGELLLDFYERKGWRVLGYTTWSDCVEAEFEQCRSALHRRLESARITREIKSLGVENFNVDEVPDSHLRALSQVPNEQRVETYKEALSEAAGKPTAAVVAKVVKRKMTEPEETREVVEPKLAATPVAAPPVAPATEPPDPWDCEDLPPFENIDEIKEGFRAVLEAQREHDAVLTKHDHSTQKRVVKEADAELQKVLYRFFAKLPKPTNPYDDRRHNVILQSGKAYVADEYGSIKWQEAHLFDLEVPKA